MLSLTREVRFTLPLSGEVLDLNPLNGLAGNLPETPGIYCELQVTLVGEPDRASNYIENIKVIDDVARSQAAAVLLPLLQSGKWTLCRATKIFTDTFVTRWGNGLRCASLRTNPFLSCAVYPTEKPMTRLTQRFDFSAAHRLHNDALDDNANRELFGKCNNVHGHGHNYQLDVTLAGEVDQEGKLISQEQFSSAVQRIVIERFDHKHLNVQTEEFRTLIPTVENIAKVVYTLLAVEFGDKLHSVRVWETGKTSAEFGR